VLHSAVTFHSGRVKNNEQVVLMAIKNCRQKLGGGPIKGLWEDVCPAEAMRTNQRVRSAAGIDD
jgi:hypothetical protein